MPFQNSMRLYLYLLRVKALDGTFEGLVVLPTDVNINRKLTRALLTIGGVRVFQIIDRFVLLSSGVAIFKYSNHQRIVPWFVHYLQGSVLFTRKTGLAH